MSQHLVEHLVRHMSEFEMSLDRELTYSLGLQARRTNSRIFISQAKYAKNLVSKFELGTTKHRRTPIGIHAKITKYEAGSNINSTLYISMIGSLLYLTVSRLDVCYNMGVCAILSKSQGLASRRS